MLWREGTLEPKVIGKIYPYCGKPGPVVYGTQERIVFECPNRHQYEIKSGRHGIRGKIGGLIRFYNIFFGSAFSCLKNSEEVSLIFPAFLNHGVSPEICLLRRSV